MLDLWKFNDSSYLVAQLADSMPALRDRLRSVRCVHSVAVVPILQIAYCSVNCGCCAKPILGVRYAINPCISMEVARTGPSASPDTQ